MMDSKNFGDVDVRGMREEESLTTVDKNEVKLERIEVCSRRKHALLSAQYGAAADAWGEHALWLAVHGAALMSLQQG